MTDRNAEKKRIEIYVLTAARKAGVPIPAGKFREDGERPDFRFRTASGMLGVEVGEVLRPASSNYGILPVEEESFHRKIIKEAQREYYTTENAKRIHVNVYFTKAFGQKRSDRRMIEALRDCVAANSHRANPFFQLWKPHAPDGFDTITMIGESDSDWWSGEVGGVSLDDIHPQLAASIKAKDHLVPDYRANLPSGAKLWLLLHTGVTVARSMPIPHRIKEWKFPFRFDRVFWLALLERQFVEIHRAETAVGAAS
jgi:hypothetical protein